ncbi:MAG: spore gernimation protein GerA [Peptococcaceae bacterium BICA1-7]|nr:MAG: spore gernimation protein GerA [Peptococcaceae bacterium BICA1-7]
MMADQQREINKTPLSTDLEKNLSLLQERMSVKENFDVIVREMTVGSVKVALLFIDGLTNDQIVTLILKELVDIRRGELSINAYDKIYSHFVPYTEVEQAESLEDVVNKVLMGPQVLLIDGADRAIVIDARTYPARQPEEPDLEKVVRGSRDGFVETLVFNTALIRRRIRDPRLRMETMQAGDRSKTDVVLCYIKDVANPQLVENIKENLQKIRIDGLPMAEKAVEELISPGSYWNPFPKVRYTERPDVAAVHLLEGHVLVIVDTSPSIMITPATYWHHLQHAEEFRQNPTIGIYIRWLRFVGVAISIFLLPLWLLAVINPDILPPGLKFIGPQKTGEIPIFLQFIMAEISIDMVRMATIHTPTALASGISIVAALLLGQIAVEVGLFSSEVVMYVAIAMIGTFLTPSYELGWANRLVRIFLLVLTAAFGLPGLIAGAVIFIGYLAMTRSFGVPYLWPLIPFNWGGLKGVLIRTPVSMINIRPSILKTREKIRQAVPQPARKPEKK